MDIQRMLIGLLAFIPAVAIHEFCHAKFADLGGDPTPRAQGRVTLNPLAHLDPIGTVMVLLSSMAGAGIGWGKPVMVRRELLRSPRFDSFLLTIMGPISNLIQAMVWALVLRVAGPRIGLMSEDSLVVQFALTSLFMNVGMFVFNLIPIGPLDGHWIVSEFLPDRARLSWLRFCHGPGMIIFLVLVLIPNNHPLDLLGKFMYPVVRKIAMYLLGVGA